MDKEDLQLNKEFEEAVIKINSHTDSFPADVLLRLYAYYKHATGNQGQSPTSRKPLINAFKTNALFQIRGLSRKEAKQKYIKAVNEYFNSLE